jgi:hypothetical protein
MQLNEHQRNATFPGECACSHSLSAAGRAYEQEFTSRMKIVRTEQIALLMLADNFLQSSSYLSGKHHVAESCGWIGRSNESCEIARGASDRYSPLV